MRTNLAIGDYAFYMDKNDIVSSTIINFKNYNRKEPFIIYTLANGVQINASLVYKSYEELDSLLHFDWRLPTMQELLTLVDYTKTSPASLIRDNMYCDRTIWTSTVGAYQPKTHWAIQFSYGASNIFFDRSKFNVRCVRNNNNNNNSLQWTRVSYNAMTFQEAKKYAKKLKAVPIY